MAYACEICERTYHEKFNLDRHIPYCRFLHLSKRDRDNQAETESEPVPEPRMLYRWMQDMALKIEKLEKENAQLRGVARKQQKEDVGTVLRQHCPTQSFAAWISASVLTAIPRYLETVYQKDLLSGMAELISACVSSSTGENLPIRAFVHKPSEFYIYEKAKPGTGSAGEGSVGDGSSTSSVTMVWRQIRAEDLNQWFALIESHFQTGFRDHWVIPNMDKMNGNDEAVSQRYVLYYQKILGNGRMTTDTRYQKLRVHLYGLIKQKV
jgi:hypothetical protein